MSRARNASPVLAAVDMRHLGLRGRAEQRPVRRAQLFTGARLVKRDEYPLQRRRNGDGQQHAHCPAERAAHKYGDQRDSRVHVHRALHEARADDVAHHKADHAVCHDAQNAGEQPCDQRDHGRDNAGDKRADVGHEVEDGANQAEQRRIGDAERPKRQRAQHAGDDRAYDRGLHPAVYGRAERRRDDAELATRVLAEQRAQLAGQRRQIDEDPRSADEGDKDHEQAVAHAHGRAHQPARNALEQLRRLLAHHGGKLGGPCREALRKRRFHVHGRRVGGTEKVGELRQVDGDEILGAAHVLRQAAREGARLLGDCRDKRDEHAAQHEQDDDVGDQDAAGARDTAFLQAGDEVVEQEDDEGGEDDGRDGLPQHTAHVQDDAGHRAHTDDGPGFVGTELPFGDCGVAGCFHRRGAFTCGRPSLETRG